MKDKPTEQLTEAFRAGMCIFTSRAIERLKTGKPGDRITREQLEQSVGRQISPGELGYANVMTAIRHIEGTVGVVWRWSRTDAVFVCLNPHEVVADVQGTLRRSGKFARRAMRTASTINPADLTEEDRHLYRAACVQSEIVRLAVAADTSKRLIAAKDTSGRLNVSKLLEAIEGQKS